MITFELQLDQNQMWVLDKNFTARPDSIGQGFASVINTEDTKVVLIINKEEAERNI